MHCYEEVLARSLIFLLFPCLFFCWKEIHLWLGTIVLILSSSAAASNDIDIIIILRHFFQCYMTSKSFLRTEAQGANNHGGVQLCSLKCEGKRRRNGTICNGPLIMQVCYLQTKHFLLSGWACCLWKLRASGCGSHGRAITCKTRCPWFESSQLAKFYHEQIKLLTVDKTKIKK